MVKQTACGVAAVFAVTVALSANAQGPGDGSLPPRQQRPPTVSELSAKAQQEEIEPAEGRPAQTQDLSLFVDPTFVPGPYWLGVVVSRPAVDVGEKLNLPKDQGLLVERVQPNSPAAKAGLKERDVLLKANGKPLGDIRYLMKLINEVKEGKLTLDLLRNGKHETLAATLAKRPPEMMPEALSPQAREWFKRFGAAVNDGRPLQFEVFGPGQIVPRDGTNPSAPGAATAKVEVTVRTKADLADGTRVEITRTGDGPAKVLVTRDKDRWECTPDELGKLPDKIRPEVERLLQTPLDHHLRVFAQPGGLPQGNMIYFGDAHGANMEKRIAEMQRQIDDLKLQVKALQDRATPKE